MMKKRKRITQYDQIGRQRLLSRSSWQRKITRDTCNYRISILFETAAIFGLEIRLGMGIGVFGIAEICNSSYLMMLEDTP